MSRDIANQEPEPLEKQIENGSWVKGPNCREQD